VCFTATLAACGCEPKFTPPSQLDGVRVLAVHQDPASGSPGASVKLDMLVTPASANVAWIGGCNNPPSRQYFACEPVFRAESPPDLGSGTSFSVTLPDDILSAAPELATDPLHYGVSYVFFAACSGTITPGGSDGFPFGCVDGAGAALGPSDFVIGFTTIYSYDGAENQNSNPMLTGVDFDGTSAAPASPFSDSAGDVFESIACDVGDDEACDGAVFSHHAVCSDNGRCAPLVSACQGKKCPTYQVLPHVDPASFEMFTGQNEILWASYYTTLGSFDSDTRLVDDRVSGPTTDIGSGWQAPGPDGSGTRRTSTIWVTLNDQRGGVTWASFDVVVE